MIRNIRKALLKSPIGSMRIRNLMKKIIKKSITILWKIIRSLFKSVLFIFSFQPREVEQKIILINSEKNIKEASPKSIL